MRGLFKTVGLALLLVVTAGAAAWGSLYYVTHRGLPAIVAGVSAGAVAQEEAAAGVVIASVEAGSPAAKAGVERGDILLSVNGREIATGPDLREALGALDEGESATLVLLHGDERRELTLAMESWEDPFLGMHPCFEGQITHHFQLEKPGAIILSVEEGSPAAEAGLQRGERVVAVDGETVATGSDLAALIGERAPGDRVTLEVEDRAGERRELVATLAAHPEEDGRAYLGVQYGPPIGFRLERALPGDFDLDLEAVPWLEPGEVPSDTFRFHFGEPGRGLTLPDGVTEAIIVGEVLDESPAASAALEEGDLILALDGEPVTGIEEFVAAIGERAPGDEVTLTVQRGDEAEPREVVVTLGENEAGKSWLGVRLGFLRTTPWPGGEGEDFVVPALPGFPQLEPLPEEFLPTPDPAQQA